MNKILFINACVRKDSRTFELAKCVIDRLDGKINEVKLEKENIKPLDEKVLAKRNKLIESKNFSEPLFKYAIDFANADTIIIAAPYWDLSFPAILKIYFEAITVCGITFCYENGVPRGLCKAKRLIYITTAGGYIQDNLGYDYVKALAQSLYGIENVMLFKADGLDIDVNDVTLLMEKAKEEIKNTFNE